MTAADLFDGTAGQLVAGVDEVGRGPLAGDVVAAAVILTDSPPGGITDSKMLTPERREALAELIRDEAVSWALGRATVAEIDELMHHKGVVAYVRISVIVIRPVTRWISVCQIC